MMEAKAVEFPAEDWVINKSFEGGLHTGYSFQRDITFPGTGPVKCQLRVLGCANNHERTVAIFRVCPHDDSPTFILKFQRNKTAKLKPLKVEVQQTKQLHPRLDVRWVNLSFSSGGDQVYGVAKLPDMGPDWLSIKKMFRAAVSREQFWSIILKVILELMHVHEVLNSVHFDIKPENYLTGADGLPWLMDLGFFSPLTEAKFFMNTSRCTPNHAAPELLHRVCSAQADWYSLGVTLLTWVAPGLVAATFRFFENCEDQKKPELMPKVLRANASIFGLDLILEQFGFLKRHPKDLACLRSLLAGFLTEEPGLRLTGEDALRRLFMQLPELMRSLNFAPRATAALRPASAAGDFNIALRLNDLRTRAFNRLVAVAGELWKRKRNATNLCGHWLCLDGPRYPDKDTAYWYRVNVKSGVWDG